MSEFRIPFGSAVETAIDWLIRTLGWFFNFIRTILQGAYKGLEDLLVEDQPPGVQVVARRLVVQAQAHGPCARQ